MKEIKFKISYKYGDANNGRLDMYDASVSLQGFAKALSITTHALLNDGEVRRKGNNIDGAKLFIHPSRKGSFEELITLAVDNKVALAIGTSILANVFYDLIKWTWSITVDKQYEPETHHVKRLKEKVEPFIGEIEEALEVPLEQAHRPIKQNEEMTITIVRPKVGDIIKLDTETLQSVSLQTESDVIPDVIGNVTKYNILSGIGRFYDDNNEKTVSFKLLDSVSTVQKQWLTWSLHHAQEQIGAGKIKMSVQRVLSAKGAIKRYLVHSISQA
ncbi:hypothetical protein AB7X05_00815 [Providencia rettgeri]